MVDFTLKDKITYKDLAPLLNEWHNQTQSGMLNASLLIRMYICTCTTLTPEQIDSLTIEELDEVMQAISEKFPLEKLFSPFIKLVQRS
ncbi:MAG: hypothetical protein QXK74_07475 [Candidatus Nitrosocaldaceae archaeon]